MGALLQRKGERGKAIGRVEGREEEGKGFAGPETEISVESSSVHLCVVLYMP